MDEKQIVDYLLGRLPEEQAERLDELSITDDAFVTRMRDVENDLVDSYIKGALKGDTLKAFETSYLASPRRRQKVEFARTLSRAARPEPEVTPWAGWSRLLAVAAALILVASGVWTFERSQVSQQSGRPNQSGLVASTPAAPVGGSSSIPSASELPSAGLPSAVITQPGPAPLVVLEPETRGAASALPVLDMPAGATEASFALKLEVTEQVAYAAALKDPATGRIVWRSQWLAPSGSGDRARLLVAVPSALLKPQHYTFDVSGRSLAGATEIVGSYAFEVTRH